jgi:hypothetical protein
MQKSRETAIKNRPRFCSIPQSILYEFLRFEVAQTSMDIIAASADNMAASVTIFRGQSNLKTQKFVQNRLRPCV